MRHFTLFFLLVVFHVKSQCVQQLNVQFYNSTDSSFSNPMKVSATIGKGSEISNSYNYINYDQESLYCIINGLDRVYTVKLFSSYSSIYQTSCSSIASMFANGYVQGKDEYGRIWKVFKPTSSDYGTDRSERRYNPVTPSINAQGIRDVSRSIQDKIDRNRNLFYKQYDALQYRLDILKFRIEKLGNPATLVKDRITIVENLNRCLEVVDFASNKSTTATISCSNRQMANLDILEMKIDEYSIDNLPKEFMIIDPGKGSFDYCSIKSIRNIDGNTVVEFNYISPYVEEGWISIGPETSLYDITNKMDLRLVDVSEIEISPKRKSVPYNTKITFKLIFEKLPLTSKKISIFECGNSNCFNFYGVEIDSPF